MIEFIKQPNLPQGQVKAVICGVLCRELEDFLDVRNIKRYYVDENPYIDVSTSTHADMLSFHLGGNKFVIDSQQTKLIEALHQQGACVFKTAKPIKGKYPNDIGLNFIVAGECLYGKIGFCDEVLLCELSEYKKCDCKQGYCKCSVLIVDKNAFITDDKSIFDIASKNGVDCLLISKGDVTLPGHEYGFIGGASAKISKDEILFFGDITKHKDYKKIAEFISKHGCKIISLNFPLTDFGGMIPITQETP